jgi:hypothetical protein
VNVSLEIVRFISCLICLLAITTTILKRTQILKTDPNTGFWYYILHWLSRIAQHLDINPQREGNWRTVNGIILYLKGQTIQFSELWDFIIHFSKSWVYIETMESIYLKCFHILGLRFNRYSKWPRRNSLRGPIPITTGKERWTLWPLELRREYPKSPWW